MQIDNQVNIGFQELTILLHLLEVATMTNSNLPTTTTNSIDFTLSGSFQDDIKNKLLTSSSVLDAMKKAVTEIVELEITTWVSEPSDLITLSAKDSEKPKPGNRMYSKINIIEGDITNEVGSQFIANGPYNELRQFHLDQVKESREIIQKNIESLQKLFYILTEIVKKKT